MKKNFLILLGVGLLFGSASSLGAHHTSIKSNESVTMDVSVRHHYKMIIDQHPYHVEVCKNVSTSGDKTGDALKGAILGGILGKAITGDSDGAKLGALFGGVVGHNESNATAGTQRVCSTQIRYKESSREIYSHSVLTFWYGGRKYEVKFKK